jgi:signal transduction histidine kinase
MQLGASSGDEQGQWTNLLLSEGHDLAAVAIQDGAVVAANAGAASLFGRRVVGARACELFDAGSRHKLEAVVATTGSCELQIEDARAAEPRAVRFLVLPSSGGGRLLLALSRGALAYSEDQGRELMRLNDELTRLTRELSRRAQELAEARDRLERVAALRRQFIAILAHDLKSPLGAARLVAQSLTGPQELPADKVRAMGQRLDRCLVRMTALVDTVLTAARLEIGEIELARKPTSLDALVRDAIDDLQPLADERRVTISCNVIGDVTAWVDATWMGEVMANLLANAIRHSPEGRAVTVSLREDGARVRCDVADRGPGVPPEMREAIFEPFRQSGSHCGSAGLGLYVARSIVTLHGGRIGVEEADGGGARFCVDIPKTGAGPDQSPVSDAPGRDLPRRS